MLCLGRNPHSRMYTSLATVFSPVPDDWTECFKFLWPDGQLSHPGGQRIGHLHTTLDARGLVDEVPSGNLDAASTLTRGCVDSPRMEEVLRPATRLRKAASGDNRGPGTSSGLTLDWSEDSLYRHPFYLR